MGSAYNIPELSILNKNQYFLFRNRTDMGYKEA